MLRWTDVRGAAALLLAVVAGCSDNTGPQQRPDGDLNVLRLAGAAPPLQTTEVSFWAKRGSTAEGALYFLDATGGRGDRFVRLTIPSDGLLARPDGTPIAEGDSVLITLRAVDPAQILFEFQPSGLRFRASDPAELEIEYQKADDDFNRDGDIDEADDDIEDRLAIWRQEAVGDPFVRLGSAVQKDLERIEAELLGFSRFAIAY
jgi:hypothetical protein